MIASLDIDPPSLAVMPIVGRQWRSISIGEYAARLASGLHETPVLPLTDRERRFIGYLVEAWLEDWWNKNSQG